MPRHSCAERLRGSRNCEASARGGYTRKGEQYLKLAAIYREMAFTAMPSATDPEALELTLRERSSPADKLRRMTVANGCTPPEAENAA
jgi:hypothetical protein